MFRIVVPTAFVAAMGAQAAAESTCIIHGAAVSIETIDVKPPGGKPFTVGVWNQDVKASFPTGDSTVSVEVRGAITFTGTATKLWTSVIADDGYQVGSVQLAHGAHVITDHADRNMLVGSAVMYADDVMQGEAKDPDEAVSDVRIPCDHVSLDWVQGKLRPYMKGDGSWWYPRKPPSELVLRSEPKASAPAVTYRSFTCGSDDCLLLVGIERRGDWQRVGRSGENMELTGWARSSDLVKLVVPAGTEVGGRSYGCSGNHHNNTVREFGKMKNGRIKIGTKLYAAPGSGAWATVIQDGTFTIGSTTDDWVEVTGIPGVSGLFSAYAPASAVHVEQ